ncbi:MAG: UDP-N-acetylglucosamine 2-epimerase (non-hydrolyzing) [Candidatus Latescibacterota bacterium]|nr:MAG: UDP-N-acetylglucosamine 2-epimerase (non-hydrolyzing) [Candidatus Latescibacterota bacterium]
MSSLGRSASTTTNITKKNWRKVRRVGYEIIAVVGARPNYMKVAPVWREFEQIDHASMRLVHTGQHYDTNMSKVFFDDLKLPKPEVFLGVGSGSHSEQTSRVMLEFEKVLNKKRPDLVIVVGDVNSTMAATLVAAKMEVPVAHVEAGLRSFDRSMPEEINRMVTDILADLLFTTEPSARENLIREGIDEKKIHFVGNVMIDSLNFYRPMADSSRILDMLAIEPGRYGLVTLHRPSNVDDTETLKAVLGALVELGGACPLIFPAHPRTRKMIENNKIQVPAKKLRILDPIGYLDFAKLMMHSRLVLTDSGGIQEETTVLGIPCLTIRDNTERPITIEVGTNRLVGASAAHIVSEGHNALKEPLGQGKTPELWDGRAAKRIVRVIDEYFNERTQS